MANPKTRAVIYLLLFILATSLVVLDHLVGCPGILHLLCGEFLK